MQMVLIRNKSVTVHTRPCVYMYIVLDVECIRIKIVSADQMVYCINKT